MQFKVEIKQEKVRIFCEWNLTPAMQKKLNVLPMIFPNGYYNISISDGNITSITSVTLVE